MAHTALREDLRGVAFTTATPFSDDGTAVLESELASNVTGLYDAGARLFVPCGNTGEYYALDDDERVAVVRTHVEALEDDATVVGGVGGSTKTALELIERYEDAGVDGIMVMHPVHTYLHERGVVEYYRRIAEATDLGVVLYKRGPQLSRRVITRLSEIDNVVGLKFAVDDVKEFSQTVEDCPGEIVHINGIAERYALSFAIEGAEGYTTGIGNFAPEATLALRDAIRDRDWDRARTIREGIRPYEDLREEAGAENALAAANNVPAVKFGMDLAGYYGGPVREPLVDLDEEDKARAERYYERIRDVDR